MSISLNNKEIQIITTYAEMNGISVSEYVKRAVLERIEDEHDLKILNEALEDFEANPITYPFEEVERELGL